MLRDGIFLIVIITLLTCLHTEFANVLLFLWPPTNEQNPYLVETKGNASSDVIIICLELSVH